MAKTNKNSAENGKILEEKQQTGANEGAEEGKNSAENGKILEAVKRKFVRTYVGDRGVFYAGRSYALTAEQQAYFAGDIE